MWDAISGFGSALFSLLDTGVSSSDRRAANELNYWANMDTNKTNANINAEQLAAARENWKREQQNFELQRKWALEDRDYENWYNLPSNVRDRYLKAGINPVLAMQGSGTGLSSSGASTKPSQAPSFGSPPASIPMMPAHFEPTMPNGLGLSDAMVRSIELMQQSERNQTDISAIRQRVSNETAETKAKIVSMGKKDKETDKIIAKLNQDILFNEDSYEERMRAIKLGNDKLKADQAYTNALTALSEAEKRFKVDENDRAWMQLKQWIANSVSQISLNSSQAFKNYQDAATSFQDELRKIFDNSKLEELYKVNKAQLDQMLIKLKYETSVQGFKDFIKTLQGFIPFGGMWN